MSALPGSVKLPLRLTRSPSLTVWSLPPSTFWGATLFIVTEAVYSLTPPSLSRIWPLTVRVPLSVVGQLALVVPLKLP